MIDEEDEDLQSQFHQRQMTYANRGFMEEPGVVDSGSVLRSQAQFRTDSLKSWVVYRFLMNNARAIKYFFVAVFVFIVGYSFILAYEGGDGTEIIAFIGNLIKIIFNFIVAFVSFFWKILFVYPLSWIAIWSFLGGRFLYTWLLSREHNVFVVMWMDDYKTLRLVMFPKYIDEVGNPYLGGKASWIYRFFNGNPRIPFHEDMYAPFMDFLKISIEHVADGVGASTLYEGSGVILYTDPSNDVDDNVEAASIFRYVDIPAEIEGYVYRYCTLDLDRILPVNVWTSILSGMDLKYWQKYADERKTNQLLEREILFVKYDGGLSTHKENFPSAEGLVQQYEEEAILDDEDYRSWDDIGEQIKHHAKR